LGSGGPELTGQRVSSSYLISINNKAAILMDTGTGSSYNFARSGAKFEDLEVILFSHLHVDHSNDLPAFIKGSFFTLRAKPLKIYGPTGNALMPSTSTFIEQLFNHGGVFRYLSDYINKEENGDYKILATDVNSAFNTDNTAINNEAAIQTFKLNDNATISALPVHHGPIAALAWRVDIGKCSITYSGDMNNDYQTLAILAKNSDILIAHNAVPESALGVAANLHMRPSQIGAIAKKANVKKLLISHRMKRTEDNEQETLRFIREKYQGSVVFVNDLQKFNLEK